MLNKLLFGVIAVVFALSIIDQGVIAQSVVNPTKQNPLFNTGLKVICSDGKLVEKNKTTLIEVCSVITLQKK